MKITIICASYFLALSVIFALGIRWRKYRDWHEREMIPEPIRDIIGALPADSPEVFRECIESLYQATMDLAAEVGACPSCGSDPANHIPPTKYPHVIRFARGGGHNGRGALGPLYCGVCGVESIESYFGDSSRESLMERDRR